MAWSVLGLCLDWPILTLCLSGVVPQSGMVLLLFLLSFWYWTEHWPWLPGSLPCYSTWALPSLLGCVPSLVVAACISCLGSEPLECPFLSVVSGSPPLLCSPLGWGFHSLLWLDLLVRASCSFLHGLHWGCLCDNSVGSGFLTFLVAPSHGTPASQADLRSSRCSCVLLTSALRLTWVCGGCCLCVLHRHHASPWGVLAPAPACGFCLCVVHIDSWGAFWSVSFYCGIPAGFLGDLVTSRCRVLSCH